MTTVDAGAVVGTCTSLTPIPSAGGFGRPAKRKQRCWNFQVNGVTSDVTEADLLASVSERYTTVKRLVVRTESTGTAAATAAAGHFEKPLRTHLVEVQFTGPQPSEGPGGLLCDLLCASSVEAQPVELPRGRKKRARTDASSEASDSDVEDGSSKKTGGLRKAGTKCLQLAVEEVEEHPGEARAIASKPPLGVQGGSTIGRERQDEPSTLHRRSVNATETPVIVSAGVTPVSPVGLFKSPPLPCDWAALSIRTCTPVSAEQGSTPASMPPQPLVASQNGVQQQPQHLWALHHDQQKPKTNAEGHGGEVLGRKTKPQDSADFLDAGPTDLPSSASQPPAKSRNDPLLVPSSNAAGTLGSNGRQSSISSPMSPVQAMQRPLRGLSFGSEQMADSPGGEVWSGNMVMDLSDADTMFESTEGDIETAVALGSRFLSSGSNPDFASDGRKQQQKKAEEEEAAKWRGGGVLPMEHVMVEPSQRECDFEGRPPPAGSTTGTRAPVPTLNRGQCHLVFTGLEKTGHDLCSLRVTAHFGADSVHTVGKVTSPVQTGPDGRAYAAIFYPSMREIWPELYSASNIRVVEVDVVVEIRSDSGEYQYVGPQLKVTYLRASSSESAADFAPRPLCRRTASRFPVPFANEGHGQVSYSCVDYSCANWFSDMCHSMFRGSGTSHEPLLQDPTGLMAVDI